MTPFEDQLLVAVANRDVSRAEKLLKELKQQKYIHLVHAIRRAYGNTRTPEDRQNLPTTDGLYYFTVRDIHAFAQALAAEGVTVRGQE